MADLAVGSTIAGCRLDAIAGRGGMGVVYRATQLALDRTVALKAIAPQLATDTAFRERFQRESHLAASIEHSNVIPVYEAGKLDETLYLIMRWVDGTDLRALLSSEGALAPADAVRLLRPVASALSAAHRRGLIHRDVKPANVLIAREDEHVYLTDFGIARRTDGDAMTRTGVLVGTLDYTAPERIEGGKGSPASDIYSFGCMLFEALTGHVPFERSSEVAKMYAHMHEPVPSPATEVARVPPALDQIVAKAMAKRPENRFTTAAELVAALDGALQRIEATRPRAREPETVQPEVPTFVAPPTIASPRTPARPTAALVPDSAATLDDRAAVGSHRPGPRRRAAALLVLVALGAALAVAIAASIGGGAKHPASSGSISTATSPRANVGTPVVREGAASGVVPEAPIKLTGTPAAVAADGTHAWAVAPGQLVRIGTTASTPIAVSGNPSNVAVDPGGRVWMTGAGSTGVTVFDPNMHSQTQVSVGEQPNLITMSADAAWGARAGARSVTRVPLAGGAPQTIPVQGAIAAMQQANGRIWVAPTTSGPVVVLDDDGTVDNISGPTIPAGTVGITSSNGVWFLSSKLTRVDPRASFATGGVYAIHTDQATVGPRPAAIGALAHDNSIWVLTSADRTLTRIATRGANNNTVIAQVTFPGTPEHLAVGDHILWVDVPSTKQIFPIKF